MAGEWCYLGTREPDVLFAKFAKWRVLQTKAAGRKTTPAMSAGKADHVWTLDEIVGLIHEKPAGRFRRIGAAA